MQKPYTLKVMHVMDPQGHDVHTSTCILGRKPRGAGVLRAFPRFLPEELVGGYTVVQKAWQAWTLVDFGPKRSVQDGRAEGGGGVSLRRAAPAWGLAQFGREVFCPWRPLEVRKPWQARTFAVAELAPSMTLKSY